MKMGTIENIDASVSGHGTESWEGAAASRLRQNLEKQNHKKYSHFNAYNIL